MFIDLFVELVNYNILKSVQKFKLNRNLKVSHQNYVIY